MEKEHRHRFKFLFSFWADVWWNNVGTKTECNFSSRPNIRTLSSIIQLLHGFNTPECCSIWPKRNNISHFTGGSVLKRFFEVQLYSLFRSVRSTHKLGLFLCITVKWLWKMHNNWCGSVFTFRSNDGWTQTFKLKMSIELCVLYTTL